MDESSVRDFFEAVGRGDRSALAERLAEDCVMEFPGRRFGGRFEGRRRVQAFLRSNARLFPEGLRFEVSWVGRVGDRALAQWTNAGRTRDGVDYGNRGVTVFRFDSEGRIRSIEDYLDTERLSETWPA